MKTFAALAIAALIAAAGLLWMLSNPTVIAVKVVPLKPSAALPSFHPVQANEGHEADDARDTAYDALRGEVLAAADNLKNDPCNPALKARYIEAATKYARARLSIAPCVGTYTCSAADKPRLDQVRKTFGSALDRRVSDAMQKVHTTDIFVMGDFSKDVTALVAEMAADPEINPYASTKGKEIGREFRTPASCRAASLH